jgi:hypothetical protein
MFRTNVLLPSSSKVLRPTATRIASFRCLHSGYFLCSFRFSDFGPNLKDLQVFLITDAIYTSETLSCQTAQNHKVITLLYESPSSGKCTVSHDSRVLASCQDN